MFAFVRPKQISIAVAMIHCARHRLDILMFRLIHSLEQSPEKILR